MFRIHKVQLEFFEREARARYLSRLRLFLESDYPECFDEMSPDEVAEWVASAVAVCDRYGVTTERDATQLVLLLLLVGIDADRTVPWMGEVLRDAALLPVGKIRSLLARAREEGIEGVDDVDLGERLEAP
jgi:hypothetical protein